MLFRSQLPASLEFPFKALLILLTACMLFLRQRPVSFAGLAITGLMLTTFWRPGMAPIETARSFFGVHTVVDLSDGSARLLFHGNTMHGAERLRNEDGTPATRRAFDYETPNERTDAILHGTPSEKHAVRYQMNPQANWGPGTAAKGHRKKQHRSLAPEEIARRAQEMKEQEKAKP